MKNQQNQGEVMIQEVVDQVFGGSTSAQLANAPVRFQAGLILTDAERNAAGPPDHFMIPLRIFELDLSGSEFRVYTHVACCAAGGAAWFTIGRMAQICRLPANQILKGVLGLVARGLIKVHQTENPTATQIAFST